MKTVFLSLLSILAFVSAGFGANTAPTVVIQSATMRPGTTLMDVKFRVNDPDDATVKVRALAFIDGNRTVSKMIKPVTFAEGTESLIGDAIPSNGNHTITWDVASDWNIQLGQIKFEILAMDGRGLLPFDWITIPAAGGNPEVTISKNSPTDAEVLNALFWLYADGDPGLTLANGTLTGNVNSGGFNGVSLGNGTAMQAYSTPFVFKRMNLGISEDLGAANAARAGVLSPGGWHAANRSYTGLKVTVGWGYNYDGQTTIPSSLTGAVAIAAGNGDSLALKSDGTVVGWGRNEFGQTTIPSGLTGVIAIAAGYYHSLALKSDGSVVAWGYNYCGQTTIPSGLTEVIAIAAGSNHSLALKSDGSVVGWGYNSSNQTTIPSGLTGVTAIAACSNHSLALKSDGTVVGWGSNSSNQTTIPSGLTDVTAIAAGSSFSLALKSDGTVVGWGDNYNGQTTIPNGLTGVTAIAAGSSHSLALKSDGTVVGWGSNSSNQTTIPSGLTGVTAIAAGLNHNLAIQKY